MRPDDDKRPDVRHTTQGPVEWLEMCHRLVADRVQVIYTVGRKYMKAEVHHATNTSLGLMLT